MKTLAEFPIQSETYSVTQDDDGDMFLQCRGDTMHIDPAAAVRIAKALLIGAGRWAAELPVSNVVQFDPCAGRTRVAGGMA